MEINLASEKKLLLAIKRESKVFIIPKEYGILAAYDLKKEEWNIECVLPEYCRASKQLFFSLEEKKQTLYLVVPDKLKLLIYHFISNTYEEVDFPAQKMKQNHYRTASVLNDVNNFIFVPIDLEESLLVFDKLTKRTVYYDQWGKDLRENLQVLNLKFSFIRRDSACIINHTLYCLVKCDMQDIIFSINLSDMKLQNVYQLDVAGELFGMKREGNSIWIHNRKDAGSELICWNPRKKEIEGRTGLFPDIKERMEYFKDILGSWCITFKDGKMIILEPDSHHTKEQKNIFLYFIQDCAVIFTDDNKTIKIADLSKKSIKQLYIPKSLFIKAFSEISKISLLNEKKNTEIGQLIFNTISNSLK